MAANGKTEKPFIFRFIDAPSTVLLELTNVTDHTLKSIEILTIFLKDEETSGGGPSQAHIRFDVVASMKPREKAVLSHRTWINGKPADTDHDQLERLKSHTGRGEPLCTGYFLGRCGGEDAFSTDTGRPLISKESTILNSSQKRNYVCGLTHGRLYLLSPLWCEHKVIQGVEQF